MLPDPVIVKVEECLVIFNEMNMKVNDPLAFWN